MNKSTDRYAVNHLRTAEVEGDGFLSKELRLLDRYEIQKALVDTLGQTERHKHLASRVAKCHHTFRHWRCENNHDWAEAENSCSVRVCPHDSRRRSLVLAGRMEGFLVGRDGLRYAVLAERNCEDLAEGLRSLWAAWTSLRRSVCWKRKVQGCIVALEVTRNVDDGTWHPHLNVLMEGEYFPFEELNQAWIEATKHRGQTSFIRAADAGTVRELIKYVTKITDLLDDAEALDEFLSAVDRRRLVRTYGSFYGLPVADEENPDTCCPDCKTNTIVRLGYVPPQQVSLDFNGVLRVGRAAAVIAAEIDDSMRFYPSLSPPSPFKPTTAIDRRLADLRHRFAATSRIGEHQNGYSIGTGSTGSEAARNAGSESARAISI